MIIGLKIIILQNQIKCRITSCSGSTSCCLWLHFYLFDPRVWLIIRKNIWKWPQIILEKEHFPVDITFNALKNMQLIKCVSLANDHRASIREWGRDIEYESKVKRIDSHTLLVSSLIALPVATTPHHSISTRKPHNLKCASQYTPLPPASTTLGASITPNQPVNWNREFP